MPLVPPVKFRYFAFLLAMICGIEPVYSFVGYKEGYYFKGAEKVAGYVYFAFDNYESFFFKKELQGRSKKMQLADCDGFAFEDRKFVKLTRLTLKAGLSNKVAVQGFAEHIIDGTVNLYKVYSSPHAGYTRGGAALNKAAGNITSMFLEKNNNRSYILVSRDPLKFKQELTGLFKDQSDIAQKIGSGYYTLANIIELVNDYNAQK